MTVTKVDFDHHFACTGIVNFSQGDSMFVKMCKDDLRKCSLETLAPISWSLSLSAII